MSSTGSKVVRNANQASPSRLQSSVSLALNVPHDFKLLHAQGLDDHERSSIWMIFEANMRDLYSRSSFGWDPPTKLMELFHPLSRFILVQVEGRPVAFAMFRFEYENYRNLLYCYDIQVSSDSQGAGLGTVLLRWLESIAIAWRMDKLVLTVLKENVRAAQFYGTFGFIIDATSPGYIEEDASDVEDVDYEILSKEL